MAKVTRQPWSTRKLDQAPHAGSLAAQHCRRRAGRERADAATAAAPAPAPRLPHHRPAEAAAPTAPSGTGSIGIHLSAQFDAGFIANPLRPNDGLNLGQLFTDHANQVPLNQLLLTANKPLDPKNPDYQWGFKAPVHVWLGRALHAVPGRAQPRRSLTQRYQLDVVEANVLAHLPWLTEGGIDLKAGQYSTPLGYETIDPSTNPFYSHSYIFQFGLPFKHTGALTTTHVNSMLDIYGGIDTGTNTTFRSVSATTTVRSAASADLRST